MDFYLFFYSSTPQNVSYKAIFLKMLLNPNKTPLKIQPFNLLISFNVLLRRFQKSMTVNLR